MSRAVRLALTEVEAVADQEAQRLRHDDGGAVVGDEVDHQQRQRGDGGQQQLVAPLQLQHVVGEPQQQHTADGEQRRQQLHKLDSDPVYISRKIRKFRTDKFDT